jgi:protoporphyrinogen oxidase
MHETSYLIVGAGVSGLAFANFVGSDDYLIVEADTEIGGFCKTVVQDGFVWDYSGHFFHFKNKEMETYLLERMPADEVRVVEKLSSIRYRDRLVDFPFQKNIHQLPQDEFIECLYDLYFKDEGASAEPPANFKEMLYRRFGRGISEKFLIPYNEKLYATDLARLDVDAMGRFFPYADLTDIIRNFRQQNNTSYNSHFTYPRGGAIQYVRALAHDVADERIALQERLVSIDLKARVARTNRREIRFGTLISSMPFPVLMGMVGDQIGVGEAERARLSWNKVLVFNLGFDRKGWDNAHWVYFPERKYCFYRIGFYDNIFHTDRMSLYVELGFPSDAEIDVPAARAQVLADLETAGVIDGHKVVSEHNIVLDPAYVHIRGESTDLVRRARTALGEHGVYSIGRYGAWTYCSIEDNMLEAKELAERLSAQP